MEVEKRGEGWPSPEAQARPGLPRVEELPLAESGYDRERVHEAFDAFYRHIAQLDTTLRAIEAVEAFRQQAGELRTELRALKAAGWTQQPWPSYAPARVTTGLPDALPRFAIEAAFLVVVAVVIAVAGFDAVSIVLVMALAWAVVGVVEWAASKERFARTRVPPPPAARAERVVPSSPLRGVAVDVERSDSWAALPAPAEPAAQEPSEDAEEELTVVGPSAAAKPEAEGASEAVEHGGVPEEPRPEVAAEAEPEPAPEAEAEHGPEAEAEPAPEAEAEPAPEAEAEPASEPEQESVAELDDEEDRPGRSWAWAADAAIEAAREGPAAEAPAARRRFWQRRRTSDEGARFDAAQPRHVRVLPPAPSFDEQFPVEPEALDPWEQGFDISVEEPEGTVEQAPGDAERELAEVPGERDDRD